MLKSKEPLFPNNWSVFFSLAVAVFICFSPAFNNGFTYWDDQEYVLKNKAIQTLSVESIKYLFSHFLVISYHPLTLFSLQLNYFFSGTSAFGYIFTNIIFHLFNCLLIYAFVKELGLNKYAAYFTAVLFAINPVSVESVVWIAERKDVLYVFFFLLSLIYYARYFKIKNKKLYYLSLLFFLFSCLSKAQAITLSLVLFLIDYFLSDKKSLNVLNKIPFLLVSVLFGILNIAAQGANIEAFKGTDFTFIERTAFAAHNYLFYIMHPVFPFRLSAFYQYPEEFKTLYFVFIPAAILLFTFSLYYFRKNKLVIFCILFFTFNIFFLLQLFPVGDAMSADRYSYFSSVGIYLLLIYAAEILMNKSKRLKIPIQVLAAVYLLFLCQSTFARCGVWKNGITLWTDVINKNPTTTIAYVNRGANYFDKGNTAAALNDFEKAIQLDSNNSIAKFNAATIYFNGEDYKNCLRILQEIDSVNPSNTDAFLLRAYSKNKLSNYPASLRDVEIYLGKNKSAEGYTLAGLNCIMTGNYSAAKTYFENAIVIDSNYTDAFVKQGVMFIQMRDTSKACNAWIKAELLGDENVRPFITSYCK